ncbi:MAG: hypothetical protein R3B09_09385 [Nannocystaceae bacterium]
MTRTSLGLSVLLSVTACTGDSTGTDTTETATETATDSASSTSGASSTETSGLTSTSTSGDPSSTGSSDPTSSTGAPEAGQSCDCDPNLDDCGPVLCTPVFALCMGDCADLQLSSDEDEANIDCILEALRDRKPGAVSMLLDHYQPLLWTAVLVEIFPDGSAWLFHREAAECMPVGYSATGPDAVVQLKDPAYFAECLADPDPVQRFLCARDPAGAVLTECAPRAELCE